MTHCSALLPLLSRGLAALLAALPLFAEALPSASVVKTEHLRAELLAHAPEGLVPGKPLWLGLAFEHQPEWHTYWKNPGDSGLPTTMKWQLPPNVEAGEIQWPTPHQIPVGPLMNYGYGDRLLLPVPVLLPAHWNAAALEVKLRADWLVCKEICVPESGNFSLRIPSASATAMHGALFEAALASVPRPLPDAKAQGRADGAKLAVEITGLPAAMRGQPLKFFAEIANIVDPAVPITQRWDGERWTAQLPMAAQRSESPSRLPGVLVGKEPTGVQVQLQVAGAWPSAAAAPPATADAGIPPPAAATPASFALALVLALAGGLLLNLMPCVFPVLSLKVFNLARTEPRQRIVGALAYTAGVVVSFLALAALLLLLRAGGEQLGWGFQLQSPAFIALLAVLFTVIGLNLAGVFEFGRLLPAGWGAARARHPLVDDALTGVLAVAVASPCTGPFMGVALGAALAMPAAGALSVFAALGLGMALPYLALACWPALARLLPRPGAWMGRFKVLMAFPMFATVIWLLWVLGQQAGIDGVAGVLAVLLAVAFAAWACGVPDIGPRARWGYGAFAALVMAGALAWAWPSIGEPPSTAAVISSSDAPRAAAPVRWQAWSPEAVTAARGAGRPVFVDFTAAWCVTCQFNKRTTLSDAAVLADFETRNVLLLRADWTRRDPLITEALAALGRSGVPVYALYPAGSGAPVVLSEILRRDELRAAIAALQSGA